MPSAFNAPEKPALNLTWEPRPVSAAAGDQAADVSDIKKTGLCPEVSVQRAVADGLENVVFSEVIGAAEVSEGAGDFENAVVGAGAEVHLAHRMLELRGGCSVQGAVLFDEARRHGAVGVNARMLGETLALHASRCFDAFADV